MRLKFVIWGTVAVGSLLAVWIGGQGAAALFQPDGTFTQVSQGSDHACGVKTDGTVTCWGHDYYGDTIPPRAVSSRSARAFFTPAG